MSLSARQGQYLGISKRWLLGGRPRAGGTFGSEYARCRDELLELGVEVEVTADAELKFSVEERLFPGTSGFLEDRVIRSG
jgi:hypothetical protein